MESYTNLTAVITGAGSGIGRALATELIARGANVALSDLNEEGLRETVALLPRTTKRVSSHTLNVADPDAFAEFREDVLDRHGRVDLLINNAGITMYGEFEKFTLRQIQTILDVNVRGVMYGCHTFLPDLIENGGHIINMSSMAAISGIPRQSTYCASKAAVRALSESLSAELADKGVGVSWMIAGPVRSNILANAESQNKAFTNSLNDRLNAGAMTAEDAATTILDRVSRGAREIRLTGICEAYHQANRLSPGLLQTAMRAMGKRLNRRDSRSEGST